jgi:hypothetical protein
MVVLNEHEEMAMGIMSDGKEKAQRPLENMDPVYKAMFEHFSPPSGQGKDYFVFNWTILISAAPLLVYLLAFIEKPFINWILFFYSLAMLVLHLYMVAKIKQAMSHVLNPFSFVTVVLIDFILIVIYFGMMFTFLQKIDPTQFRISSPDPTFINMIYYSMVTIATVGYGDIVPTAWVSKLLAMSEIFVGIWFLIITLPVAVADQVERIRHFRITKQKALEELERGVKEGRWETVYDATKGDKKNSETQHSTKNDESKQTGGAL